MAMLDSELVGMKDTLDGIDDKTNDAILATVQGGREHAEHLLRKIQMTAPVDSGEYRDDWRIETDKGADDEIHIVNSTDHGPFLVFPNTRMIGSTRADDPARGIIHNVRGIVFSEQKNFRESIIQKLKQLVFR